MTGDVDLTNSMRLIAKSSVIVTTPEKWDGLTRSWKDHIFLFGAIDLLLIDEVHHLGEERGSTLEAVVVRMRMLSELYCSRIITRQQQQKGQVDVLHLPTTPKR